MSGFTPEQIAADRASIVECVRVTRAWTENLRRWSAALDEVERQRSEIERLTEERASVIADCAAVFQRNADQWDAETGPDYSPRVHYAYTEGARVLTAWAEDPTRMDGPLSKIAGESPVRRVPLPDRDALVNRIWDTAQRDGVVINWYSQDYNFYSAVTTEILAFLRGESGQ